MEAAERKAFDHMQEVLDRVNAGPVHAMWLPLGNAPWGGWLEVCGYTRFGRTFLALARFKGNNLTRGWTDIEDDPLSDRGWTPTHWRLAQPLPDPNQPNTTVMETTP